MKKKKVLVLAYLLVIWSLVLVAKPTSLKPTTLQRVGFRVESADGTRVVLRPIYPAKLGGEIIEGLLPKRGELLTCSVHDEAGEMKDKDGNINLVHKMVLYCLSGQKVVVIGVEY